MKNAAIERVHYHHHNSDQYCADCFSFFYYLCNVCIRTLFGIFCVDPSDVPKVAAAIYRSNRVPDRPRNVAV